jgi:hypothetical protein
MKRKTSIQPRRAEDALYDSDQPEFAYMAERWKPPSSEYEFRMVSARNYLFVASLACSDQHVARGIARRFIHRPGSWAARTLLDKRDAVRAEPEQCQGLEGISEETWGELQKKADRVPPR